MCTIYVIAVKVIAEYLLMSVVQYPVIRNGQRTVLPHTYITKTSRLRADINAQNPPPRQPPQDFSEFVDDSVHSWVVELIMSLKLPVSH